ncbi:LysM peptidoglycan-binding domain-containing protein, partial [Jeotgalicoccus halotolerans]|uniref:LysM peptidoglycan-binding domain-containing protein n=1 Tax=Jeotgalicoccus halotolerans TaxID=157227 RepID=UPI00351469DB
MKKTVVSVATLTAITGVAATAVSADEYTISSGDTLWGIANEVGTSVADLKADNELSSDIIFPGDVLTVNPEEAEKAPAPASNESTYIVKPGDTLGQIGAEFSLDYNEIMKWNNLSSDLIFVGQELSIDGSAAAEPAAEVEEAPAVEEVQEAEPAAEVEEAPAVEEVQEAEPAVEVEE